MTKKYRHSRHGVCHCCGTPGRRATRGQNYKDGDLTAHKGNFLCRDCFCGDMPPLKLEDFATKQSSMGQWEDEERPPKVGLEKMREASKRVMGDDYATKPHEHILRYTHRVTK